MPGPRRDARLNRERLLQAATVEVRRRGDRVPMADIARRAGVGVGTLYRHFPTREALLQALTERAFALVLDNARAAAAGDGTAVDAIERFLLAGVAARDELTLPLHGVPVALGPEARRIQRAIRSTLAEILDRGQADGTIRADVTPRDIVLLGAQLAQPLAGVRDWDRVARRQARIYLDGLLRSSPTS